MHAPALPVWTYRLKDAPLRRTWYAVDPDGQHLPVTFSWFRAMGWTTPCEVSTYYSVILTGHLNTQQVRAVFVRVDDAAPHGRLVDWEHVPCAVLSFAIGAVPYAAGHRSASLATSIERGHRMVRAHLIVCAGAVRALFARLIVPW